MNNSINNHDFCHKYINSEEWRKYNKEHSGLVVPRAGSKIYATDVYFWADGVKNQYLISMARDIINQVVNIAWYEQGAELADYHVISDNENNRMMAVWCEED